MNEANHCEAIHVLMSAYLDDELDDAERQRVERHIAACDACRAEFDAMEDVVQRASAMTVAEPPDEVWDRFLDNVYNRLERRVGWTIFILGCVAVLAFGSYHYIVDPWAPATVKTLVATPTVGVAVLFVSVLRQRLSVLRSDRYSRDVKR